MNLKEQQIENLFCFSQILSPSPAAHNWWVDAKKTKRKQYVYPSSFYVYINFFLTRACIQNNIPLDYALYTYISGWGRVVHAGGVRQMPYLAITHEKKSIIFSSARIDYFSYIESYDMTENDVIFTFLCDSAK